MVGNDEKKRVYKELSVLRRCRSQAEFETMLSSFLGDSLKDHSKFLEYFVRYYVHRKEMWAVCFRDPEFPDTNAHAESFHRVLKFVALAGQHNRRVAVLIDTLLEMEKDFF